MNFWREVLLYMWHNLPLLICFLIVDTLLIIAWVKAEKKSIVMLRLYSKHNGNKITNWFELKEADINPLFAGRSIVIGGRHWWID